MIVNYIIYIFFCGFNEEKKLYVDNRSRVVYLNIGMCVYVVYMLIC